jgi:hypothetical protein
MFLDIMYLLRSELEVILDHTPTLLRDFQYSDVALFVVKCFLWPADKFVSFTKYHTATPFAFFLRDDLPKNPSLVFFPSKFSFLIWEGWFLKFLRNRLMSQQSTPSARLFWGYLQGIKRGTKQVGEDFVLQSLKDHVLAMSKLPPPDVHRLAPLEPLMTKFYSTNKVLKLNWTLDEREELVGFTYPYQVEGRFHLPRQNLYEPSRAAAAEIKRSHGGGREFIRHELMEDQGLYYRDSLPSNTHSVNKRGQSIPALRRAVEFSSELFRMIETRPGVVEKLYENTPLYSRRDQRRFVEKHATSSVGQAYVSAVLEPIKVRLITKTEAFTTAFNQVVQKSLWAHNAQFPQFVLTTRPLVLTDFHDLLDREKSVGVGSMTLHEYFDVGSFWNSGDYKAATDNLDINLTKLIMETWISKTILTPLEISSIRRILYEQQLHYPELYEDDIADFMDQEGIHNLSGRFGASLLQKNGQLMGSVLSFPILCVANLLCYWNTLRILSWIFENKYMVHLMLPHHGEDSEESFCTFLKACVHAQSNPGSSETDFLSVLDTLADSVPMFYDACSIKDLPVLINGDDILFRSNPFFNVLWERYGYTKAGFQKSVGKNYLSRDYLTINSECFRFSTRLLNEKKGDRATYFSFTKIDYLNVALLLGQRNRYVVGIDSNPVKGEESLPITDQYNLLIKGANDPLRAHKRFMHYRKEELLHFTKGFQNFFGSTSLGGMGALPPLGLDLSKVFTTSQKRYAYLLYSKYQGFRSESHTLSLAEFKKLFQRTTFSSDTSSLLYPVKGGHFVTFRIGLNSLEVLNRGESFHDLPNSEPLLFRSGISLSERSYKIEGLTTPLLRKLLLKNSHVSSQLKDTDILLFFQPVIILTKPDL